MSRTKKPSEKAPKKAHKKSVVSKKEIVASDAGDTSLKARASRFLSWLWTPFQSSDAAASSTPSAPAATKSKAKTSGQIRDAEWKERRAKILLESTKLKDDDVLVGEYFDSYKGNVRFLKIVGALQNKYDASSAAEKAALVDALAVKVSESGRFLRPNSSYTQWIEVTKLAQKGHIRSYFASSKKRASAKAAPSPAKRSRTKK